MRITCTDTNQPDRAIGMKRRCPSFCAVNPGWVSDLSVDGIVSADGDFGEIRAENVFEAKYEVFLPCIGT